jgi:hypothetical protein
MNATMITCPSCGAEIPLSEALKEQFRHENEARLKLLAGEAEQKARADFAVEKGFLEGQLAEERRKCREAQQAELDLRKERETVEARTRELDLEVARRVDGEKQRLSGQQDLRLKEKDQLIEDQRKALEDAKRKSEQGSQERQGEVLEIDIEAELARRFPRDAILPVAKGARGADLVQEVRDGTIKVCGTIVWEIKNTRHWQPAWIDKLKADQRAIGVNLAVLVSTAIPDSIVEFGRIGGVWVAGLRAWPALAVALREQLIEVAFAHAATEGKGEKMECLYHYLAGDQFRRRIEATVEAFTALRNGLTRERNAMERIWNEREKQIERVLANTAGMYGEVRGILGSTVPPVAALELEARVGRLADATADMVAK